MKRKKTERLKKQLLIFHWHNLVKDNGNIGTSELQKRLKPISYLKGKLNTKPGNPPANNQLNIFTEHNQT